ncbi:MAG: murein L,D-transpeptidase catalytic domain-containing protein [Chitinophagaceae bacterium]
MLRIVLAITLLVAVSNIFFIRSSSLSTKTLATAPEPADVREPNIAVKAAEALRFAKNKNYNTEIGLLIDMSIPSSEERFFIFDFMNDSILAKGLVTHGSCNEWGNADQRYSNVVGSGCSSLGRYRVGGSYMGRFGKAWKLHGLDSSNSNAYERYVVLHSHDCVPEQPNGEELCQSLGCPTVSPGFLTILNGILDKAKRSVLLWMFEG